MNAPKIQLDHSRRMKEHAKSHTSGMDILYSQRNLKRVSEMCRISSVTHEGKCVEFCIDNIYIQNPQWMQGKKLFPSECRMAAIDYLGSLEVDIKVSTFKIADGKRVKYDKPFLMERVPAGYIPIMVGTVKCNTYGMSAEELASNYEEFYDTGGYFMINGNEKVCRLSIAQKRNYPFCIERKITSHGKGWDTRRVAIRTVRNGLQGLLWLLFNPTNGKAAVRLSVRKSFHLDIFVILKSLMNVTEEYICDQVVGNRSQFPQLFEIMQFILQNRTNEEQSITHTEALLHLGNLFVNDPAESPEIAGNRFLNQYLLNHLNTKEEKFKFLIFAFRRLLLFNLGSIAEDDIDAFQYQEVVTPRIVFTTLLQNILSTCLRNSCQTLKKLLSKSQAPGAGIPKDLFSESFIKYGVRRSIFVAGEIISRCVKTGNFPYSYIEKIWLNAFSGIFIMATRNNFLQFLSHFKVAHRGSQFKDTKLTRIRKLRPESFGFICPVHTPDGTLGGLMNHMTWNCRVTDDETEEVSNSILLTLKKLGMGDQAHPPLVPVILDGNVIGGFGINQVRNAVTQLRIRKVLHQDNIPKMLEIAYCEFNRFDRIQYPILCLSTHASRFMRPVYNLSLKQKEFIGPLEQAYLDICIDQRTFRKGVTTHQEIRKTNILSVLGNLTPYSEHNQSPRNIYETGMAKQTMAHPLHSYKFRSDNKQYKLEHPQKPICKTFMQSYLPLDEYSIGTNAVVAVIGHTGHDMEDAMIINKSSMERGFAYATVFSTKRVDFTPERNMAYLSNFSEVEAKKVHPNLDFHGLPSVGTKIQPKDCVYSYRARTEGVKTERSHYDHTVLVDQVTTVSNKLLVHKAIAPKQENVKANITFRTPKAPEIGDKFASRHGQKGICSLRMPSVDLPFSESGIQPDIIINPNAFPSRMTIGMLIESMAGKAGAIHGTYHDATSFGTTLGFNEKNTAVDYFGDRLRHSGYNYYGNETLYDGITGEPMNVDIFIGVVYYQRLKHMVSDKYQVRSDKGPVDFKTHQPLKGRKRAGGVRFGEMERDALIAHGASMVLRDRLFHCSDESYERICSKCGDIFGVKWVKSMSLYMCIRCKSDEHVKLVAVPYSFCYLTSELASMNIQLQTSLKS